VSVAMASSSGLAWTAGFGMADLENFVPVTPSTVIRLGSISKPITAVAVMQLVEQGKIELDAPIQRYVPSFPEKPWPVTVRQLLGHLGGVRHYSGLPEVDSTRHYTGLAAAFHVFRDDPLLAEPGTKYSYTTYGFNLLGATVDTASGMKFPDYLRANIFQPAGMAHIGPDDVYAIIPHRARGYRLNSDQRIENCSLADTSNKIPGGGLSSTAGDLVKFALAVHEGKLVRPATVQQMFTSQHTRDGKPTGYGFGFGVSEFEGHKRVGHGGGQQGITTDLVLFPAEGIAIAVMTNLERARLSGIVEAVSRVLLQ
ncbi:MAG: beta-lactamase family protein, partial [Chloroflexi bacterium]|nr:beta-lactamase family protein [Chloroflexota bacterium]